MLRREKEITDPAALRGLLERALHLRLALVDGEAPYLVPLSFALDGPDLVLHSSRAGRKLEILRRNPRVAFLVEEGVALSPAAEPCDVGMDYQTVIGEGEAAFVTDPAEKVRLLQILTAKYTGAAGASFPPAEVRRTEVLRVRVARLTGKRSPPSPARP